MLTKEQRGEIRATCDQSQKWGDGDININASIVTSLIDTIEALEKALRADEPCKGCKFLNREAMDAYPERPVYAICNHLSERGTCDCSGSKYYEFDQQRFDRS